MDPVKTFLNVKKTTGFMKLVKRHSDHPKKVTAWMEKELREVDSLPHVDFGNIAVETYSSSLNRDSKENDRLHAIGMEQLTEAPLFPAMTFMVPIKRSIDGPFSHLKHDIRALVKLDLEKQTITYVWKAVGDHDVGTCIIPAHYTVDEKTGRFCIDILHEDIRDDVWKVTVWQVARLMEKVTGETIPPELGGVIAGPFMNGMMIDLLDAIVYTLADLHLNDYYPFSVEPVKGSSHKSRGKGQRPSNVRRIIYLNRQIRDYDRDRSPGQKDNLAQKRSGHARRGSWWTMRALRFKNHPNFGKEKVNYRKAAWVGDEVTEYQGNVYRILLPSST